MNSIGFDQFIDAMVNSKLYVVPDYQRDYSWGNSEVQTLLDDIESLCERNAGGTKYTHFCGALVFIDFDPEVSLNNRDLDNSARLSKVAKKNIIDGQQRITTLSLLILAIRDFAKKNNIEPNYCPENKLILDRPDESGQVPILNLSTVDSSNYYRHLLFCEDYKYNPQKASVKKIKSAYDLCSEFIENYCMGKDAETAVNAILDEVLYSLMFVPIECNNEYDAFQIFESLNATGLSLTPAEQVKNYLIMKSDSKDTILKLWDNLLSLVGEKKIVNFLSHYLFVYKHSRVPRKDVYTEIKKMHDDDYLDTEKIMEKLVESGEVYKNLRKPYASCPAKDILLDFKDLRQEQVYVPLLAAAEKFDINSKDFKEVADALLVYVVRHMVCGQSTNKFDTVFGKVCEILSRDGDKEQVIKYLKSKQQPDDIFKEFFENLTFEYTAKPQGIAKTYLRRIEEEGFGPKSNQILKRDNLTVEHIVPKQPEEKDLRAWLGDELFEDGTFNQQDFINQYIKSIGNLVLLFAPENSKANNKTYVDKREDVYLAEMNKGGQSRRSPYDEFNLVKDLVDNYQTVFDGDAIRKRARFLSEVAVKVWK